MKRLTRRFRLNLWIHRKTLWLTIESKVSKSQLTSMIHRACDTFLTSKCLPKFIIFRSQIDKDLETQESSHNFHSNKLHHPINGSRALGLLRWLNSGRLNKISRWDKTLLKERDRVTPLQGRGLIIIPPTRYKAPSVVKLKIIFPKMKACLKLSYNFNKLSCHQTECFTN